MAPEMLAENEDARRYNFLVDMWVTEVVTNEMFTDLKGVVLVKHFVCHPSGCPRVD